MIILGRCALVCYTTRTSSEKSSLPQRRRELAYALVLTFAVAVLITSRETRTIDFRKVPEPGVVVIVRTLGLVALRFLPVVLTSLETIFVRLGSSLFAVVENILAISHTVRTPWIVAPTPW